VCEVGQQNVSKAAKYGLLTQTARRRCVDMQGTGVEQRAELPKERVRMLKVEGFPAQRRLSTSRGARVYIPRKGIISAIDL